jgi:hypothetical protein
MKNSENSYNINIIVGILHFFLALFISLYGLLFNKSWFDYIYILYIILVIISWTFFNGECMLTYYHKKQQNENYNAGEDCTDLTDMYLLFGSKELVYFVITISIFLNAISEFIVLQRNQFSIYLYTTLPLFHIIYAMLLRTQTNLHNNELFLFIQEIFKIYFTIAFIFIFYKIMKKI